MYSAGSSLTQRPEIAYSPCTIYGNTTGQSPQADYNLAYSLYYRFYYRYTVPMYVSNLLLTLHVQV